MRKVIPPLLLLLLHLLPLCAGECVARLPTASTAPVASRIVAGLESFSADLDNVVTIAQLEDEQPDYFCMGSLIAPEWVITAAQCFILPNTHFVLRGATSLSSNRFEVVKAIPHPGFNGPQQDLHRDDIQLVRIATPVRDAVLRSPTPSPSPPPGSVTDSEDAEVPVVEDSPLSVDTEVLPAVNPDFNFMHINNNTDFAMDEPRYLRIKGFGIVTQPQDATEPLRFEQRTLKFADLRTAPCEDSFGNDAKRRLCTKQDDQCGPCYGDTGAPLYDVDSTGTFSVLVGITTFGQSSTSIDDIVCTGSRPVAYTAVGQYASWIKDTIKAETGEERVFFFQLPKEGISDTDLAREAPSLAVFATTSVIVILCLALIGAVVSIIVTCVVRHLRRKRKRWIEGLQAEESFVKAGEKDAIIVDPFEGIQTDQLPRFSFTGLSRAAAKGATEFSSRSIGVLKALIARDKDEDHFEPRLRIEGEPDWLPSAWDRLFMPPSQKELDKIHKIPTQHVVDDVLSGADKSVELSLEQVAYKSKREEANLEAAWAKLEIQTSLRNLSEAGGSTANLVSPSLRSPTLRTPTLRTPTLRSPSMTPLASSPRKGSRNSSRAMSPRVGEFKADTLLAAFASIDAESEQVAEETTIDSNALRALAEMKRPNVLATLRRKFSGGVNTPSTRSNDRESDGEEVRPSGSVRGEQIPPLELRGHGRSAAAGTAIPSGRGSRVATVLSNTSGLLTRGSLGSQHSSMMMDYFSEDYSISGSSSDDDDHVAFEDMFDTNNRRYTEDRRPQTIHESRSILGFRGMRKSQNRSFESLDRNKSSESLSGTRGSDDLSDLAIPEEQPSQGKARGRSSAHDLKGRDLPISSSSMSSDLRPRSSGSHRDGRKSASQTQTSSELASGNGQPISVYMEDERIGRASARVPLPKQRTVDTHGDRSPQTADDISVRVGEEIPFRNSLNDSRHSNGDDVQRPLPAPERSFGHERVVEDRVSVHMEEVPNFRLAPHMRRKSRPASERMPSKAAPSGPGDAPSVHMEEETATSPSVRARIHAFDQSEQRSLRYSEPLSGRPRRQSNVSVAKLKNMWNEIARRNSEGSR